ncbi:filamin-C-like isoform X2 [Littorina saxatilis]|uniref:Calponin-homology (CH) domain-containing protein n=1 Tax=Littorina saxatilis TaxID=31220 RepID=A0AAN9APZ0_9CAEN
MSEHKEALTRRASLNYTDQGWVDIQRTTFKNWVNEQLRPLGLDVEDLRTDFTDGVNLVTLVEALTGRPVTGAVSKPANQYQKIQNITVALDTVAKDGVKIINIDSSDITEGNMKLILALIWLLVLKYQGGLGAAQHRRWMLAWLRSVLPDCTINNLTTDWNDGVLLHALLEFCKPGVAPDWRQLDNEDKLNNCRKAMELARDHFDVPLVLRPEDLCSPLLDEKSALLYLSYFTRVGGPGYNATRDRIQERLKDTEISNFTTDWNDGKALADLVTSSGGHVPEWPHAECSAKELLQQALDAGKELGVEPLLTAAEIEQEKSEHLGIMAQTVRYVGLHPGPSRGYGSTNSVGFVTDNHFSHYNGYHNSHDTITRLPEKVTLIDDDAHSSHTNASSMSAGNSASHATPSFQLVRKSSIKSPPEIQIPSASNPFRIDIFSVGVIMESKMTGREFDPDQFKVEAESPSGRVIRMVGDGHYSAQFTPDEIGRWRVSMFYNNKFMDGCPIDVCDPSQVRVRDLRGGLIGKQQQFLVDCTGAGKGDLGVDITHKGKRVSTFVKETSTPRLFKITYTPYDAGPYDVNVHFNRAEVRDSDFHSTDPEERQRRAVFNTSVVKEAGVVKINASCDWEVDYVTGGPFVVHITDSSDIQVYGMKDGTVCSSPELIADCTKVGDGEITADVTHHGHRYPCKVRKDQPGVYRVNFKPKGPGVYKIWINYDGMPVKGSPFVQEIAELGNPVAYGDGLYRGMPGIPQTFTVDPRGHPGPITADVVGPTQNVPCQLVPQSDGTVEGTYVPRETGPHSIDVRMEGKPIEGSPFKPFIVDPSRVRVPGGWTPLVNEKGIIPLHVNKEKLLPFDASDAGLGELSAEVRGPNGRIPVAIDARNDGRQTVIFTPREEGKHHINVKWGGFPLVNSPYEGFATWDPEPAVYAEREIVTLRPIPLIKPVEEEKEIIPLIVGQEKDLTFDTSQTGPGQLTATVRGPSKAVPVAVDDQVPDKPSVLFTPQEEGKHLIDVDWNGTPLTTSPYIGYATREPNNNNIYRAPPNVYVSRPPSGPPSPNRVKDEDKDIIPLKVGKEKQIPFDTSKAPPGRLTAAVRGPTRKVPTAVEDRRDGKPVLCFTPQEEGKHYIDVDYNGAPLPQSPLIGYATREMEPNNNLYTAPPNVFVSRPTSGPPSPTRMKDEDKDIIPLKVGKEKQIPFDASKAPPGRLTAAVRGPTRKVPAAVEDRGDGKPVLCFTPEEEGRHYIDVDYNGAPLPQSPLLGYATRDMEPNGYPSGSPPVYLAGHHPRDGYPVSPEDKEIIPLKVNKEKALPFDATLAGPGHLTATVRGPRRPIPVRVEDRKNGRPTVHFTPEEEGQHSIGVNWNGRPIPQAPLMGYATPDDGPRYNGLPPVYLAGYHPRGSNPYDPEKDIIPLKVNHTKQLPFDATEAGPGTMTARVRGPTRQIPVAVDDRKNGKPTLSFTPEEEGKHLIDVDWNGQPIPKSPFVGYATRDPQPVLISPGSSRPPSVREDPDVSFRSSTASLAPYQPTKVRVLPTGSARSSPKVILSGRGLKEAEVDKPAVFHVDGTQANPGKPTAHLEGVKPEMYTPVRVEPVRPQVYKCTYVPKIPGAYKLYIKWNEHALRGSPFKVNVKGPKRKEPYRGIYYQPRDNRPLRPGQDVLINVDHPDPGRLTVACTDPRGNTIPCRFLDNQDGTRSLKMTPTMPGRHRVDIKYNDQHIMGSPYNIDISETQVHGKVRVWGPGIQRGGILNRFESNFWVDTTGAGAGELRVRIMGPKGAFHVKMRKASQKDKLYQCFYDPVEAGIYTVYIQWSGAHVEGSPFTVLLAHSAQELEMMSDDNRSMRSPPPSIAPGEGSPRSSAVVNKNDFLY